LARPYPMCPRPITITSSRNLQQRRKRAVRRPPEVTSLDGRYGNQGAPMVNGRTMADRRRSIRAMLTPAETPCRSRAARRALKTTIAMVAVATVGSMAFRPAPRTGLHGTAEDATNSVHESPNPEPPFGRRTAIGELRPPRKVSRHFACSASSIRADCTMRGQATPPKRPYSRLLKLARATTVTLLKADATSA
jgi:hypothetical protein